METCTNSTLWPHHHFPLSQIKVPQMKITTPSLHNLACLGMPVNANALLVNVAFDMHVKSAVANTTNFPAHSRSQHHCASPVNQPIWDQVAAEMTVFRKLQLMLYSENNILCFSSSSSLPSQDRTL